MNKYAKQYFSNLGKKLTQQPGAPDPLVPDSVRQELTNLASNPSALAAANQTVNNFRRFDTNTVNNALTASAKLKEVGETNSKIPYLARFLGVNHPPNLNGGEIRALGSTIEAGLPMALPLLKEEALHHPGRVISGVSSFLPPDTKRRLAVNALSTAASVVPKAVPALSGTGALLGTGGKLLGGAGFALNSGMEMRDLYNSGKTWNQYMQEGRDINQSPRLSGFGLAAVDNLSHPVRTLAMIPEMQMSIPQNAGVWADNLLFAPAKQRALDYRIAQQHAGMQRAMEASKTPMAMAATGRNSHMQIPE